MFAANIIYSSALKWQCNKVHTGVILSLERLFVCLWSSSSRVVGYNSLPTEQIWVVGSPRRSHSWLRCTQASHQLPLPTILNSSRLGLNSISDVRKSAELQVGVEGFRNVCMRLISLRWQSWHWWWETQGPVDRGFTESPKPELLPMAMQ